MTTVELTAAMSKDDAPAEISAPQFRAARELLGMKTADVAVMANISAITASNILGGRAQGHANTLAHIRRAFEERGIEFIEGGARLAPRAENDR